MPVVGFLANKFPLELEEPPLRTKVPKKLKILNDKLTITSYLET